MMDEVYENLRRHYGINNTIMQCIDDLKKRTTHKKKRSKGMFGSPKLGRIESNSRIQLVWKPIELNS
jgi:hypothetical protein